MRDCYDNFMKCDMHIHSYNSGACTSPILRAFCRESYSDPAEVYETLQRRDMDLITLTDHDSIDGCDLLRRNPNFFVSEEVTCTMPSGAIAHIGVYDLNERQHMEIQRRRNDLVSLLIYLTEHRLFFSINHVFSNLTGRSAKEDFRWFSEYFPAVETRNAGIAAVANRQAVRFGARTKKSRSAEVTRTRWSQQALRSPKFEERETRKSFSEDCSMAPRACARKPVRPRG